jgi:hypothetical protein
MPLRLARVGLAGAELARVQAATVRGRLATVHRDRGQGLAGTGVEVSEQPNMWKQWRSHFETQALRPLPAAPRDVLEIPAAWRAPLCASLARFQLGEGGEGRIAREIERASLPGIDDDYRAALKLFVREEGRHARILAGMVRSLGGTLLKASWSERLFVAGRRLLGLRLKLLVLLAAEVIGLGFYALLARRLGTGSIAEQLEQIAADEGHAPRVSRRLLPRAGRRGRALGVSRGLVERGRSGLPGAAGRPSAHAAGDGDPDPHGGRAACCD